MLFVTKFTEILANTYMEKQQEELLENIIIQLYKSLMFCLILRRENIVDCIVCTGFVLLIKFRLKCVMLWTYLIMYCQSEGKQFIYLVQIV